MSKLRRYLMAGGTFACALTTGFIMQSVAETPEPSQAGAAAIPKASVAATGPTTPLAVTGAAQAAENPEPPLDLSDVTLTSALPEMPPAAPQPMPLPDRSLDASAFVNASLEQTPALDLPVEQAPPSFDCDLTLTGAVTAAAMVDLALDAACLPNESFTLHHQGMMFTGVTDAEGRWNMTVPALAENALYIAAFGNGEGALVNVDVTSVSFYDRVVVQWSGHSGMQIHAREYGASYGDDGHVWADAARDMSVAAAGEGGFITRLGTQDAGNGRMAEIYTFPSAIAVRPGEVTLSVEAEVTAHTCGRDIDAQTITILQGETPSIQEISLAMPQCDATGDFLVLKNIVNDLKIARN
ncbi:hypothetical protein [Roseobacter sp. AzwK-3b]|uniref:hypothetical protein n=1 Tax=Roseobacter sp. AzwK-3b TaxID=351016 RepID=UPI00056178F2|nr:hypothetical protein [Roseobacter sp. AzwK-3b]